MRSQSHTKKMLIAVLLIMAMNVAFASLTFTGITDESTKNSKYSLKSLGSANKLFSISHIKTSLLYKGSLVSTPNSNSAASNFMQFEQGNTSYVLPYKYKVKVPKFKTPTPDNH